jgi:hypothetical protein
MTTKSDLPSYESIVEAVCKTLKDIIKDFAPHFKEEGSFKVRPGFGYDKFYLDWIDGSYDMSLQSLIHYILYEKGHYKKFLSKTQLKDLENVIKDYPDSIYSPSDNDADYEAIQYDILDPVYSECIRFVGRELIKKGFDVRSTFSDYFEDDENEKYDKMKLIEIQ